MDYIVAIVCAEGDPLYCHRFGTVSRTLAEEGFNLKHILPNGEVVSHEDMEWRLVESYDRKGLLPQEKYSGKLAEAYRILNSERGFRMKPHREHIRARKVRL